MTELVYQYDSYIKELEARVVSVEGREVVLDKTIYHDGSGGVQADSGLIIYGDSKYRAIATRKADVVHVLDREPDFGIGDVVIAALDWEKRYRKMRLHTAAHILSAIMYNKYGALITGGEITHEYARDDFNIEGDMSFIKRVFEEAIVEVNDVVKRNVEVRIYWLPREEALKIPGVSKLAERTPPELPKLRIVEIPGVDIQADGGPHVRNTAEIGEVRILRVENRGRTKKRIYYDVKP